MFSLERHTFPYAKERLTIAFKAPDRTMVASSSACVAVHRTIGLKESLPMRLRIGCHLRGLTRFGFQSLRTATRPKETSSSGRLENTIG